MFRSIQFLFVIAYLEKAQSYSSNPSYLNYKK